MTSSSSDNDDLSTLLLSPSSTHDFALYPSPRCADGSTPRGWSLQKPHQKKLTLGPILDLPPDGPAGTTLMAATSQEKPWYKFRVGAARRWRIGSSSKSGGNNDLSIRTTLQGRVPKGKKLCVAKFDADRTVCGIYGANNGESLQTVNHEYRPRSRYRVKAMGSAGKTHEGRELYWQTLGPSQTVLELVDDKDEGRRVALFVYTSDPAQQMDPESGRRRPLRQNELGELWITDVKEGWAAGLERVALTIGCVVEMRWNRKR